MIIPALAANNFIFSPWFFKTTERIGLIFINIRQDLLHYASLVVCQVMLFIKWRALIGCQVMRRASRNMAFAVMVAA